MVKVKLTEKLDSEILVVGFGTVDKKLKIEAGPSQIDTAALLATLIAMGASGKADEVIKLPGKNCKIIAFTGLGEIGSGIEVETLRRAAGAAARELSGNKSACFALPSKSEVEISDIAEDAWLGSYSFQEFKGNSKE